METLEKVSKFVGKYMAIIVLIVAAVALFVPTSLSWIQTSWINYLLMIVMFGMGLATTSFPNLAMATVPGAIFSVWHNISGAIIANIFANMRDTDKRVNSEKEVLQSMESFEMVLSVDGNTYVFRDN